MTGGTSSQHNNATDVIDICNNQDLSCDSLAPIPEDFIGGVSLKTPEGNPLACGGFDQPGRCMEYLPGMDEWVEGPSMIGNRSSSAFVRLANGSYWILGGIGEENMFTSEIYVDGNFMPGPSLPKDGYITDPCATLIDEDTVFFATNRPNFRSNIIFWIIFFLMPR